VGGRTWFVIAAAGRATRYGGPVPKPYLRIAGRTLLEHSMRLFASIPGLAGGAVVLSSGDRRYERLPPSLRRRLVHVLAAKPEDALFALEEGLRCRELACVIGEIGGNPKALDFTASRRLSLAAERHRVSLFLVRLDAARDLSAARMRWQVAAAPSPPPRWNAAAPGAPAWRAELFRARAYPPGEWILCNEETELNARPSIGSGRMEIEAASRGRSC